jgi:uncharacterized protein (TIGR02596 family)
MFPIMAIDFRNRLHKQGSCEAFSLLELLVVIAIVGLLSVLAASNLNSVLRSARLDTAARMFLADIDFARQAAFARNENVQLRLLRSERPDVSGPAVFWQWQVGLLDKVDSSFTPLRRTGSFPMGMILDDSATHSPLLAALPVDAQSGHPVLTFRPNGELEPIAGLPFASLPRWCFTIHPDTYSGRDIAQMDDFVTIQIDPLNSRTRTFRP